MALMTETHPTEQQVGRSGECHVDQNAMDISAHVTESGPKKSATPSTCHEKGASAVDIRAEG